MKSIMVLSLVLAVGFAFGSLAPAAADQSLAPLSIQFGNRQGEVGLARGLGELNWTDNPDETLHYDGENSNGVGLTNGGTYRGAVRFTPTQTCTVKAVLFFQRDASQNDYVFIMGEQNDSTPGVIYDSAPYTGSASMQWKRINFTTPRVVVAGTDLWGCVRVTHDSGAFPLGTDSGPMVPNRGGFISTGAGWQQLSRSGLNYNWNVRLIVAGVPGQANDVGVTRILAPAPSIPPGTYQPKGRVVNFGNAAVSNVPVTCWIDSAGQHIYNQSTSVAGPIQPGARADVTFPNWATGPARNSYTIKMFTTLSGDPNPANDTATQPTNTVAVLPFADHDTGDAKLTVTCFGAIGHDVPAKDAGNGFHWPKTSADWLYFGSFAIGTSVDYVADHYYGQPPSGAPNSDFQAVESVSAIVPPEHGDEHFRAAYTDALHPAPKGLKVTQNSYMTAQAGYNKFVVMVFDIQNTGSTEIESLYAGTFTDFDMGTSNQVNVIADTVRRIELMRQSTSANPTIGVKILEPQSFKNLTAVDHNIYVYPDSCVTDNQKFRFLSGRLVQRNSNRPFDWSTVTSVGPFELEAGASYRFSVAFVGGTSEADCRANADSAQSWYHTQVGLAESPKPAQQVQKLGVGASLFRNSTVINYSTSVAGLLQIEAYDATGRIIEQQSLPIAPGAGRYSWKPRSLTPGVYFLNLKTPDNETVTKVLLVE